MMTRGFPFRGTQSPETRLRAVPGRRSAIRARASSDLTPHFAVLGLTPFASKSDVKHAYKRLALRYHPDVQKAHDPSVKERVFREIKSAYECLMQKFEEDENLMKQLEQHEGQPQTVGSFDEYDDWEEWMGFEGGIPVVYDPFYS